jgi:hypothetical protein
VCGDYRKKINVRSEVAIVEFTDGISSSNFHPFAKFLRFTLVGPIGLIQVDLWDPQRQLSLPFKQHNSLGTLLPLLWRGLFHVSGPSLLKGTISSGLRDQACSPEGCASIDTLFFARIL